MQALRNPRVIRLVLGLSMLFMGGCGLLYEYVLSVLGSHLMGSSHEEIFVVIGIMLFAMGIAAAAQGRLRENLVDRFLWLQLLLGLIGGTAVLVSYAAFTFLPQYALIHYGLAFIVGFMVGLEIPLLLRINERHMPDLRSNLSWILSLDYVGALLAALLFAYVLLTRVRLEHIGLALGAANTLVALGALSVLAPYAKRPRAICGAAFGLLVLFAALAHEAEGWMATLEQRGFQDPVIHAETTAYQRIVLTRRGDLTRLYLNGHLQFSSADEAIYHEMLVHPAMAQAKSRERVLILGGGDGLALREVLRYPDVREVDLIEIDPAMLALASTHPDLVRLNGGALSHAKVRARPSGAASRGEPWSVEVRNRLHETFKSSEMVPLAEVHAVALDADLFVRELGREYDVAILDFPDPTNLEIAKLFSLEFYSALATRLHPEALVAIQSSSPWFAREAYLIVGQTLRAAGFQVLPYHEHIPSFGEWGFWLAWKVGPTPELRRSKLAEVSLSGLDLRYLNPAVLTAAFAFGEGWLTPSRPLEPNTRMRPVLVDAHRRRDR